MAEVFKILANTVTIGTSNSSVGSAKLVRVLAKSPLLITQFDTVANVQVGTIQMLGNTQMVLQKKATDVLTSNDAANCLGTSIAFTN